MIYPRLGFSKEISDKKTFYRRYNRAQEGFGEGSRHNGNLNLSSLQAGFGGKTRSLNPQVFPAGKERATHELHELHKI